MRFLNRFATPLWALRLFLRSVLVMISVIDVFGLKILPQRKFGARMANSAKRDARLELKKYATGKYNMALGGGPQNLDNVLSSESGQFERS